MAGNSPPRIFSHKRRIALRRRAQCAQAAVDAPRYLIDDMIEDVIERASFVRFTFRRAFLLGDWGFHLFRDLCGIGAEGCEGDTADPDFDEAEPFGNDVYDLCVVLGALDTVNDLPGALIHIRKALAPGGLMIASFLGAYVEKGIFARDPFVTLDIAGVGQLVAIGTERGRAGKPGLKIGICGEHGGDPASIAFFEQVGLDYVSASKFRVPIARLAAAQAALGRP